jgi:hypothetical protein
MQSPHLKKFLTIFFFGLFLFQANFVFSIPKSQSDFGNPIKFALEIKYPPVPGAFTPQEIEKKLEAGEIPQNQVLPLYFKYFFNLSFIVIVLVCIGVLIYGGVLYLVSGGKPVILVSAKKWIGSALLGLLILFSSYLILVTINPQLTIFQLPRLEKIGKPFVKKRPFKERVITFREIPVGALIEKIATSPEAQEKFQKILDTVEEVRKKSENLKNKTKELKDLIDACTCGPSNCQANSRVNWDKMTCWCDTKGCNPSCDKVGIKNKYEEVKKTISELEIARRKLVLDQQKLISDYLSLQKAGMLMNLPGEIYDYLSFLQLKQSLEKDGAKVEVKSAFQGLPKILAAESEIGKIGREAKLVENDLILEKTEEIRARISVLKKVIGVTKLKIQQALDEESKERAMEAKIKIGEFLETLEAQLKEIKNRVKEIKEEAKKIETETTKANIQESCKEIENIIENEIGPKIEEIKASVNKITETSKILDDFEILGALHPTLEDLEVILEIIGEETQPVTDPTTFYLLEKKD